MTAIQTLWPRRPVAALHFGLFFLSAAAGLAADAAKASRLPTPAEVAVSAASDKAVELSPFVVAGGTDKGYLATNTLSGTRLNTKLEDLGSAITVVTKEQMIDTAVLDLNDVFLYEANTEGTGNFTSFSTNRNGGVVDNIQNSPAEANRIRGVGNANIAVGNFAVNPRIPLDTYNVEGVEISRGPNSNLFGLGASSGTVNYIPVRANATRPISQVTFRADSYGGYRSSIDLNRPLIGQKFAVRVAAVHEAKGFEREPSSERIDRAQGMVTLKPLSSTTVTASFEHYKNSARRANNLTPRETVTGWVANGKPTWDPTTRLATFANGTKSGPHPVAGAGGDAGLPFGLISQAGQFYNRNSVFIDYASAEQLMSVNRTGNLPASRIPTPTAANTDLRFLESSSQLERQRATLFPLYILPTTSAKSVYDWSKINYMAPNVYDDRAKTSTVELEQTFFNTAQHLLAARAGWFTQNFDSNKRNKIDDTQSTLRVDVNEKLLDGSPNPFFLRPYIGVQAPVTTVQPEKRDIQSADLAYQWTPSKLPRWLAWIGPQKIALHGETRRVDFTNYRLRDLIQSDHPWANKANRSDVAGGGWVYDKFYVGDNQGQNIDHAPSTAPVTGQRQLRWFNALSNQWVSETVDIGENFFTAATGAGLFSNSRTEIRTLSATTQNYFFGDRLITTFGLRNDRQRVRESLPPAIDPATGWFTFDNLKTKLPWVVNEGDTVSAGAVLKLTRWLRVFYNQSDSFTPATVALNAFGELLPNPNGNGSDYGIGLSLLNDRLHLKVNRYGTSDKNARGGDFSTVIGRALRLEGRPTVNGQQINNFQTWSQTVVALSFARQGVTPTAAQSKTALAQYMGVTETFLDGFYNWNVDSSADVTAKGYEFEAVYNPTQNWRIKFTAAQQVAIDSNVGIDFQRYLETRLPVWTTAKDENGVLWWSKRPNDGSATPKESYEADLVAPYKLASANNGKPRSQVREWRWNAITNYTFSEGRLKALTVGGALRWEAQGGIGFLGKSPEADGVVRELDANKPVFDKARLAVDLSAGYRLRLFGDRVRARVQLNVRNVLEDGRLQPVAVNPNGSPFAYRIIDPRQFILSTTFDL